MIVRLLPITLLAAVMINQLSADIFRWDNGELIPGTEGITPGPGVQLDHRVLEFADLARTDLTEANFEMSNLSGAMFRPSCAFFCTEVGSVLTDANFRGSNLANANLNAATLVDANLTGAVVTGAGFSGTTALGFTGEQLYSTASYKAKDLRGIELSENTMTGWELNGQNLADSNLSGSTLTDADLVRANLARAHLSGAVLIDANLTGVNLTNADVRRSDLTDANLTGANLTDAELFDSLLSNARFTGANLTRADFSGSTVSQADLTEATVSGANLESVRGLQKEQLYSTANYQAKNLRGIKLGRNNLAEWDFSDQDLSGVDLHRSTLRGASFARATLLGIDLSGAAGLRKEQLYATSSYRVRNLKGIKLNDNNLVGWDFSKQDLSGASLQNTTLSGTDLTGALVEGARFSSSLSKEQLYSTASYKEKDLNGIVLYGDLTGWDFSGQDLTDADLSGLRARLDDATKLTDVNLAGSVIAGINLLYATPNGLSKEQIYSTASYQNKDLSRVQMAANDLTGWNFSGQNLSNAAFSRDFGEWKRPAKVNSTDFTGANLSNAHLAELKLDSAIVRDAVYNQWTQFPDTFDPVEAGMTFVESPAGDMNADGVLDETDLDVLSATIRNVSTPGHWPVGMLDVNSDSTVDGHDLRTWVKDLNVTWFGDANLDGEFNSGDLVGVFSAGEYEDNIAENSFWAEGDWNGDAEFESGDLVIAFADGGYEQGPRPAMNAVPEPTSFAMLMAALIGVSSVSRSRRKSLIDDSCRISTRFGTARTWTRFWFANLSQQTRKRSKK